MLTKSSVLHYWSSRYGINPRIGGRPVFTRNSAGLFVSQEGEVDTAIVNTPRFDWATVSGERRKVLTLEMARTNSMLYSSAFSNAAWVKTGITVATGISDPAGGTSACTLTATAANATAVQNLGSGTSLARTNSVWLRRRTGSGSVKVTTPDAAIDQIVALTADWQRFSVSSAASTTRYFQLFFSISGDAADVWNAQQEDGSFKTAEIATTTAAATRATDSCYWNFPPLPQAMMGYVRFIERGTFLAAGAVATLGSNASPITQFYGGGAGYNYYHHNGTSSVVSTAGAVPAIGDTVEVVGVLFTDGSVKTFQSINGAPVTSGNQSAANAPPSAWSDTRLYANSQGTIAQGAAGFAEIKIVKYADVVASTAQGIMDELRAFELGPNADVL